MAIIECKQGVELLSTAHIHDLVETAIGLQLPKEIKRRGEPRLVAALNEARDVFCREICEKHGQCMAKRFGSEQVAEILGEAILPAKDNPPKEDPGAQGPPEYPTAI